jgi:hypothetical protein
MLACHRKKVNIKNICLEETTPGKLLIPFRLKIRHTGAQENYATNGSANQTPIFKVGQLLD